MSSVSPARTIAARPPSSSGTDMAAPHRTTLCRRHATGSAVMVGLRESGAKGVVIGRRGNRPLLASPWPPRDRWGRNSRAVHSITPAASRAASSILRRRARWPRVHERLLRPVHPVDRDRQSDAQGDGDGGADHLARRPRTGLVRPLARMARSASAATGGQSPAVSFGGSSWHPLNAHRIQAVAGSSPRARSTPGERSTIRSSGVPTKHWQLVMTGVATTQRATGADAGS